MKRTRRTKRRADAAPRAPFDPATAVDTLDLDARPPETAPDLVDELETLQHTTRAVDAYQSVVVAILDEIRVGTDPDERIARVRLGVMVDAMSEVVAKLVTDTRRVVDLAFVSRRQQGN